MIGWKNIDVDLSGVEFETRLQKYFIEAPRLEMY